MLKVEKITEKLELLDVEVQAADPCKWYWEQGYGKGGYDCLIDCKTSGGASNPYASEKY